MTNEERKVIELALEALEYIRNFETDVASQIKYGQAAKALKEALAQPEQEPVALKPCWYESKQEKMCRKCGQVHAEAISPPQRKPLSDEQLKEIWLKGKDHGDDWLDVQGIARAIEAAHGIKGEA